jgi:glutathione S-transferase
LQKARVPVTLYGRKISPPCCKIRFILKYYGIPFTEVEGPKPRSDYSKVPVLDIGEWQLNDSHIMVKNLAPILQGRPFTAEEEALERLSTYNLMIALEKATLSSTVDVCRCAYLAGGRMCCMLGICAPVLACCVGPRIGHGRADLRGVAEYHTILRNKLGDKPFFGGKEPTVADVALFGVLVPFDATKASCMVELLGDINDPVHMWHERMVEKTLGINIF